MPLYIKFLKPPRCTHIANRKSQYLTISALITLTSDLGESFYPHKATLKPELLAQPNTDSSSNDNISVISSTKVTWDRGSRNVNVVMSISMLPGALLAKRNCDLVLKVSAEDPPPADNLLKHRPGFGFGILSAWSAPFKIPEAGAVTSAGALVERRLQMSNDCILSVWEETGESIARHIWDGGVALAAYLAQYHELQEGPLSLLHKTLQQKRMLKVLELGSGCGIVGLAFAALHENCHVLLTDLESAEKISRWNLVHSRSQLQGKATFELFDWECPVPPSTLPDIILIADCTYNSDSATSLVQAIQRCVTSRDTIIVLAHKTRHDSEAVFFRLMAEHFQTVDYSVFSTLPLAGNSMSSGIGAESVDLYTFRSIL